MRYLEHNLTDNFVIEIALDIADQFFHSRMASDPKELALKIKTQETQRQFQIKNGLVTHGLAIHSLLLRNRITILALLCLERMTPVNTDEENHILMDYML